MRVLVCDDVPERRDEVAQRIIDSGQPKPELIAEQELRDQLEGLFKQARECIRNPAAFKPADNSCFHDVDIVVIDNNLTHLPGDGPLLTAESIAGFVRAFTNAVYIVSLNVNPDVDFDLRYLVGDFSSRADLALNTEHLANPALWTGDVKTAAAGFLPWYWARLRDVADRRRAQTDFVRARLNEPVMTILGFDGHGTELLSLHARGALSPAVGRENSAGDNVIPIDKLTFRDVFNARDRSLAIKEDREAINEAEKKGNASLTGLIARVVAADIDLWFRRDVLGPQEPLVDVPHLLMRFPFLLGDRAADISEWNKATSASAPPYCMEKDLYDTYLAAARFEHDEWVKSPCFWWPALKADEKLNERFMQLGDAAWADIVFCEDRSQFVTLNQQNPPVEFAAEFEGSWSRRYVSRIEKIRYAPRSRLAL